MSRFFLLLFSGTSFFFCGTAFSQQKPDSTARASVAGTVRDSVHNYVLGSASIAIYKGKDSSLVSYQLSNNYGEFRFPGVPVGTELVIRINYIGYQEVRKAFIIPSTEKKIDLAVFNLERSNDLLPEAIVRIKPPVRMNGDTLEFNADAFKLDSNAVGEDLLRKLPGVIVWGDGTITVNGRQVSQVLVDGKPFFGGDTRVATQNISKDAIDKIQIYQQKRGVTDLLDSITEMNIKLKKDKNIGHFGKVEAGYGTTDRYEANANINFFRPATQVSLVGATNNVNKIAPDATTLLRNSSYKGNGARIDYQPDFTLSGTNKTHMGGLSFKHDFLPDVNYYKADRLSGDYFINRNTNTTNENTETLMSIGNDNTLKQGDKRQAGAINTFQSANMRYEKKTFRQSFYILGALRDNNSNGENKINDSVRTEDNNLQSLNNSNKSISNHSRGILLESAFASKKNSNSRNLLPGDVSIKYSFQDTSVQNDQRNKTIFISLPSPSQNAFFDRHYSNSIDGRVHRLTASLGDFSKWLFGYQGLASHLSVKIENDINLYIRETKNVVQDMDTGVGKYVPNQYLTGNSRYTIVDENPSLILNGVFARGFSTRYQKTWQFNLNLQEQLYHLKNESSKEFQNISYRYQKFVPVATVGHIYDRWGRYTNSYFLTFKVSYQYPTADQLVPLVDSSNRYFIQEGNPRLRVATEKDLTFTMKHSSNAANAFTYALTAGAGFVDNSFTNSSIVDSLGRSVYRLVNADGYKSFSLTGDLKKAFKFRNSQLQISWIPSSNYISSPGNVNDRWYTSHNFSATNLLDFYYTYKDLIALDARELFTYYRAAQVGIDAGLFRNSLYSTLFSISIKPTNRLSCGSSIIYNVNTSTGSEAVNFAIWNASASYRLLKGNNLEVKFSALDLLRQNKGIINRGSFNTLTHGTVNVLQQYFMATVSFFPRRFGRNTKNISSTEK
jgi:hypothetical protein